MGILGCQIMGHGDTEIGRAIVAIRLHLRGLGFAPEQIAWLEREDCGANTTAADIQECMAMMGWPD